jgi:hypothetical protein
VGADNLVVTKNQSSNSYDYSASIGFGYTHTFTITFTANTMSYPPTDLQIIVYKGSVGTPAVIPSDYDISIKSNLLSEVSPKVVTWDATVMNYVGPSTYTYYLKVIVMSPAGGVIT